MTRAILVVPPLLKYAAGPLLGPAMLAGAAEAAGHTVHVLDLNIEYLGARLASRPPETSAGLAGDHDKPRLALREIEAEYQAELRRLLPDAEVPLRVGDALGAMAFDHDAVERAALTLADGPAGRWITGKLLAVDRPDVVGISVLFGGQVLWALATTILAKRRWPAVTVIWGGPHVTALRDAIGSDPRHGRFVDGFVFGYAEETFVQILEAVRNRRSLDALLVRAGSTRRTSATGDPTAIPRFDRLEAYGVPRLTIPVQSSRGCAYGLCTFCTYPAIEGAYRAENFASAEPVVQLAERRDAVLCFKDSLVLPERLRMFADRIRGRVRWSACTKLHAGLDRERMKTLADAGCETLEFGLETLEPESQALIQKRQTEQLLLRVVEAASTAGIGLVVNYITGFPHEDAAAAEACLRRVEELLAASGVLFHLEHNVFQLERLAPMASARERAGIRVVRDWPWSSVLDWEPIAALRQLERGAGRRLAVVT